MSTIKVKPEQLQAAAGNLEKSRETTLSDTSTLKSYSHLGNAATLGDAHTAAAFDGLVNSLSTHLQLSAGVFGELAAWMRWAHDSMTGVDGQLGSGWGNIGGWGGRSLSSPAPSSSSSSSGGAAVNGGSSGTTSSPSGGASVAGALAKTDAQIRGSRPGV